MVMRTRRFFCSSFNSASLARGCEMHLFEAKLRFLVYWGYKSGNFDLRNNQTNMNKSTYLITFT